MDFKHGEAWVFVTPETKEDGIHVSVRVGHGVVMVSGHERKRAKFSIATLGPFSVETDALEAGRAAAIEWLSANPGFSI